MTKLSATGTDCESTADVTVETPAQTGTVHVNARVACEPAVLDAVAHADDTTGTRSAVSGGAASFKPGYPRPVHRLAAAQM